MTPSSNRRETRVETVGSMRRIVDQVMGMDSETTLSKLHPVMRERLASPRMMPRLAMRRARAIAPDGVLTTQLDDREAFILSAGSEMVSALCALAGTHALWEEVIRLVQRQEREALDASLGITSRDVALRGREHRLGLVPLAADGSEMSLENRILREGALSWACWISARPLPSARRLRVITSQAVSARIAGADPGTDENRKIRRSAVDVEIDALMQVAQSDGLNRGAEDD